LKGKEASDEGGGEAHAGCDIAGSSVTAMTTVAMPAM
jgi:hypothetical protein